MKQTLTKDMFRFQMNQIRPDNFSYEGQGELFDYLDEMDSELEYDPIAICCDFSQCSLDEFLNNFPDVEIADDADRFEKQEAIMLYIQVHGFWCAFVEEGKQVIFENF
jgi:hypothetical protein